MTDIFKLLIERISCPIWIISRNNKIQYVNKAFLSLNKLKLRNVIGKKNSDIFNDTDIEEVEKACYDSFQNSRQNYVLVELFDECYETYMIPIKDGEQNLDVVIGVMFPHRLKKNKQCELKKHNDIMKTIMDNLPDVIFYKNKGGEYIGYNKKCKEFYKEKGVQDIYGKTDLELCSDKKLARKIMQDDKKIMERKKIYFGENVFKKEKGKTEIRDEIKVPVISKDGEAMGIVGISRDSTKKKLIEEKLRYLSYTDTLTGTYNRTSFEEKLKELNKKENLPLGIIMGDVNGLKLVNDTFGHLKGDELLKSISYILKNVCGKLGYIFRWGGDEFIILIPNADSRYCEHIISEVKRACLNHKNDSINLSISLGAAVKYNLKNDINELLAEAEEKVYRQKLFEEKSVRNSMINSLREKLRKNRIEDVEHIKRLKNYTYKIGVELGFNLGQLKELLLVTEFHDIGNIALPKEILLKSCELTKEEFEIIKTHPEKGFRILQAINEIDDVAMGVLTHHERWDGHGYPLGLSGDEIPLYSRILAVVDAFDSMTRENIYRKPKEISRAIDEIIISSGSQFDPEIVNIFIKVLKS